MRGWPASHLRSRANTCRSWGTLERLRGPLLCDVHPLRQGGATVTCPTGNLAIYAEEIFIDPASTIDLSAVSALPSGYEAFACVAYCNCTNATTGGSGGGGALAGESSVPGNRQASYYGGEWHCGAVCDHFGCVQGGAPKVGTDETMDVAVGGAGGTGCNGMSPRQGIFDSYAVCYPSAVVTGGLGGGTIRLVASQSVKILGRMFAKGENGGNGSYPSGGGGGGTILIATPSLSMSGELVRLLPSTRGRRHAREPLPGGGALRVQIGAAPAQTSFFGYVNNSGGAVIRDALVHLEPYRLSATTDANGYFLFSNVRQGPYTATVSSTGATTLSQLLTITASTSPWNAVQSP